MSAHESVPDNFVIFHLFVLEVDLARSCCLWIRAVYNKLHYSLLAALSGGRGEAVDMKSGQFCNNSLVLLFFNDLPLSGYKKNSNLRQTIS